MPTAIGIAGLLVAIGTAAYSGVSSSDARSEAKKQSKDNQANAARLEKEFADTQSNLDKSTAGKDARNKQKQKAAGAIGRRDTLLTGATGIAGDPAGTTRKTLLGA